MIESKEIIINKDIIYQTAETLYKKTAGTEKCGKRYDKLRRDSERVRKIIDGRVSPKAVYSYYDKVTFSGRHVVIDDETFYCPAFEQIDPHTVKGAYIYFVTAGDFYLDDEPIMDQLLADIWGTSFTDAAREYFEKALLSEALLSDDFGPGFYGMDVREMNKLAALTDHKLIGVTVKDSSVILPVKSCGGIYFHVNKNYVRLDRECEDCRGNLTSCSLCNIKKKKNINNDGKDSKMFKCTGICSQCGRCKNAGIIANTDKRKTKLLELPGDFKPDTGEQGYGIAFDIGTTTVVGMLWDIFEGREIGAKAKTNPQNAYGLDVISRITFAEKKEGNLDILHSCIVDCLNDITKDLCKQYDIPKEAIVRATVGGNTTMLHLFAGYDPKTLAIAPFSPAYTGSLFKKASSFGLKISEQGDVFVLPNIAGHVGGDIVAGVLASRLLYEEELTLFIDIGTNGEIVLSRGGKALTCSTAAGPAFEGASIYQGMRAAPGAVEKVIVQRDEVLFRTIEEVPPVGVCGSGLIDAVAQMLKAGVVNKKGRILSAEDYEKAYGKSGLQERLRDKEGTREFVLVFKSDGEDIVITQNDVREVQLAKGAIAAGIDIMMAKLGKTTGDIKKTVIAGAFGSFIDKESAVTIGLLPDMDTDKIHSAGNTAGAGVLMALASADEALASRKIPEQVEHVELAEEEDFQNTFLKEMIFK